MNTKIWESKPPKNIPFDKSNEFNGIIFTGEHAEYSEADTWYPTWASDGNMYSPWTDGKIIGNECWSIAFEYLINAIKKENANEVWFEILKKFNSKRYPATGNAKITGDDPLKLKVLDLGTTYANSVPYGGRYPCGTLVHNGVWYYGTYCVDSSDDGKGSNLSFTQWDTMGPFVGFRISKDYGENWIETTHTPSEPLFNESGKNGKLVKIGSPHFVDFGKNMEYSPDGKAYMLAHGASKKGSPASWVHGSQVYLLRVTPSPENINDITKYEFYSGTYNGKVLWSHDFNEIKPLLEWDNHLGCVTATYIAGLNKYIMCIIDAYPLGHKTYNTIILESDKITGPWKLISYMEKFGGQAYFVNLPSKFISKDGKTAWICYSANWSEHVGPINWESKPEGSGYKMCLQHLEFDLK